MINTTYLRPGGRTLAMDQEKYRGAEEYDGEAHHDVDSGEDGQGMIDCLEYQVFKYHLEEILCWLR